MRHFLLLAVLLVFVAGCSQNIDQVSITPRQPPEPHVMIGDAEHQGATPKATSNSSILATDGVGGNSTRTNSTSPSFRMTSGIGVD